ncbi:hypothetical protein JOF29_008023 [Kribbella aluminosa]|uniref:Uncharacterized protein n=1 Tax=Kribbella aluminosa TaxID=416017 RepID=A0ABS4UZ35_9ACTN|nr:hypothetical protein [Kribbella aluminosa]MBP2356913.1 hypothetical protein [Kribbella aluminosa]
MPLMVLNGPPTKTRVPLSDTSIAYTSALAFGFHGSRSPWISRTAPRRLRTVPSILPNAPPMNTLLP